MSRQQAVGGCLTAVVTLFFASCAFFGWSTFSYSIQSFSSGHGAKPSEHERAVLLNAIYDYSPTNGRVICLLPSTRSREWTQTSVRRLLKTYNRQYSYYGKEDPSNFAKLDLPDDFRYKTLDLRGLSSEAAFAERGFLVPLPWETGRCDGWVNISGPVIDRDLAYIVVARGDGYPEHYRCYRSEKIFMRNMTMRSGAVFELGKLWDGLETCAPVY